MAVTGLSGIPVLARYASSDWVDFYQSLDDGDINEDNFMVAMEELKGDQSSDMSHGLNFTHADVKGEVKVTFGESQKTVWDIGKDMIKVTRANTREKVGKHNIVLKDLLLIFFSRDGPISQVLMEELSIPYEELIRFLMTWCILKGYGISIQRLHSKNSRIDKSNLMEKEAYTKIWRLIDTRRAKAPGTYARERQQMYERLQQRMNEIFKRLHVSNHDGRIVVSLDDDKVHFGGQKGTDTCGLKPTVHAVCRRRGFNNHQAVDPMTGAVLCAQVEEVGDTATECYKRIVRSIFGSSLDLVRAIFCSDRGYWNEPLIKDFLLPNGGDVHGTLARREWVPYTYDQQVNEGSNRRVVNKVGPSAYFLAHCDPPGGGKKLAVGCLRNGTGSASIGMSTLYRENHFECVLKETARSLPLVLTATGIRARLFRHFGGQTEHHCADALLGQLSIRHVTERQGGPEWFIARRFGISGYPAHMLLSIMFRRNNERETPASHVKTVESYYNYAADPEEERFIADDEPPPVKAGVSGASTNDGDDSGGAEATTGAIAAAIVDGTATVSVTAETEEVTEAREILDECNADDEFKKTVIDSLGDRGPTLVRALLELMGGKPVSNVESNRKKVKEWLEASEGARPLLWLKVSELTARFKAKYGRNPPSKLDDKKKPWLINKLASGWEGTNDECSSLMDALIRTGFLPQLKGTTAELCELGHKMEPKYGFDLLKATKGGIVLSDGTTLEILHLFRAGLLQSEERPCQKASPDFLALARIDGAIKLIVVEMKARCTGSTVQRESDRVDRFRNSFTSIKSDSPLLRQHIENRNEAGQLLHLASTIGVKHTLLAVGDKISLTSGALVEFQDDLLEDYVKCMEDLYESTLRCFYDDEVPIPEGEVKAALIKAKVPLDFETFMQSYRLWRALTKAENLPLPLLLRIIPMLHQFWNDTKYGSDITTQHICRHAAPPPVQSPSTVVVDRQLMTMFREVHALNHMFRAKKDLDANYDSLLKYRKAVNNASTFFDTIMDAASISKKC